MANKYATASTGSGLDELKKKKRMKGRSNSYDERPLRVATQAQKDRQHHWRLACLDARASEGRLTAKNITELQRLELVTFAK